MAASIKVLQRYVWLIDTIRSAGHITFKDIWECWEKSTLNEDPNGRLGKPSIALRTFRNHLDKIHDYFGISIKCNRRNNTYFIAEEEHSQQSKFLIQLIHTLSLGNQLLADLDLFSRVLFEDTPGGQEHIPVILEALQKKKKVKFEYYSFYNDNNTEKVLEPYGLKQSRKRWYLVGKEKGTTLLWPWALDRISQLKILDEDYQFDKNLDVQRHFKDVIGVNVDTENYGIEKVVVRIFGNQRNYINTLSLHASQRVIEEHKDYSDYEFTVLPEYEFIHAILQIGEDAEIISPEWVRADIKGRIEEMMKKYD